MWIYYYIVITTHYVTDCTKKAEIRTFLIIHISGETVRLFLNKNQIVNN
jgi:hypothetical protein